MFSFNNFIIEMELETDIKNRAFNPYLMYSLNMYLQEVKRMIWQM